LGLVADALIDEKNAIAAVGQGKTLERHEHQDGGRLFYPQFKDVSLTPVDLADALCKN
jgi:hypothetical protein